MIGPSPDLGLDRLDDLDALYREHGDRLVRLCRGILGPDGDAEDAAHEAILKAWASRERFDPARPLWPWLATIARNTCIDLQRHRTTALGRSQPVDPSPAGPEDLAMQGAHRDLVRDAIHELPASAREVLLLHVVEELGYAEIAARQARSQGAIRTAVTRARQDLRDRIEVLARSRGAWPLAGLTGGITQRALEPLGRWRAAAQRRAGLVSCRTSGVIEQLAASADGLPARVVLGGIVAATALAQQGVVDSVPPVAQTAAIEASPHHEATSNPAAAGRDLATRQAAATPAVLAPAQPLPPVPHPSPSPTELAPDVGAMRAPAPAVDAPLEPDAAVTVPNPGRPAPPAAVAISPPSEPEAPLPEDPTATGPLGPEPPVGAPPQPS